MSSQQQTPPGPPYPPTTASLGGLANLSVDVPVSAVFMALFIGSAVGHMTIFQINKRRGHKFLMSGMLFGFSMARIVTMIMRIVWACNPTDIRIAIAAQIFVAAGVLLLFVINLLFAQRVVRAQHPKFGWHPVFSTCFKVLYALIPIILVMVITVTVQSFFTLDPYTKLVDHNVQLGAQTFLLFVAFLPLPLVCIALAVPRTSERPLEKFGEGRWRSKIVILLISSALLTLGAGFRVGTNYLPLQPIDSPPWYYSKACFWIFNFVIEIIVAYSYIVVRVDKRFHIPNASRSMGGYAASYAIQQGKQSSIASSDDRSLYGRATDSINSEEQTFDGQTADERDARGGDEEAARGSTAEKR